MRKRKGANIPLDEEEQEILEAFQKGELKRVKNFEQEKVFAKKAAENFFTFVNTLALLVTISTAFSRFKNI